MNDPSGLQGLIKLNQNYPVTRTKPDRVFCKHGRPNPVLFIWLISVMKPNHNITPPLPLSLPPLPLHPKNYYAPVFTGNLIDIASSWEKKISSISVFLGITWEKLKLLTQWNNLININLRFLTFG